MKILYMISKFLLLPGAYIRGFWEHMACRILRIPVEPIGYIRPDEACGHAEHSLAKTPGKTWFLVTFPGFMNFNMGMTFFIVGIMGLFYVGITIFDSVVLFLFYIACLYMGMALLNSLFPLTDDILDLWDAYGYEAKSFPLYIVFFPVRLVFLPLYILERIIAGIIHLISKKAYGKFSKPFYHRWFSMLYRDFEAYAITLFTDKSIKVIAKIFGIIFFPWAVITRIGAFFEKHAINFLLGILLIVGYCVFVL